MPTMEGSAEEGQPSGSREDRITQHKPPVPLDFEAINLADSWKRWRREVELYLDLAMCGSTVIQRKTKLWRGTSSFRVSKTQANR